MAASWRTDRRSSTERGYTYQWRKARARYLQSNPLCVYCMKQGRTEAAAVVDHIVKHGGNQDLFWDESNWQALCKLHHDSTKQREEKRQVKSVQIGDDGYPIEE